MKRPFWAHPLFFDLITLVVSLGFGFLAALPFYFLWIEVHGFHPLLQLLFFVFVFLTYPLSFLLVVAGYKKIRGFKIESDVFLTDNHPQKTFRLLREVFFNNFTLSLFLPHFNHFFGFQTLYYRMMGAKIGKNVIFGRDILIHDFCLLEIGDDVSFGQSCQLTGHIHSRPGKMIQGKISIGKNTMIGAHVFISPDVKIGVHCVIGLYSLILPGAVISDGTYVPPHSVCRKK